MVTPSQTWLYSGNPINVTLGATVAANSGLLTGSLFGVTQIDGVSGDLVPMLICGVFELPKLTTDTPTFGVKLYWDDTNKRLTTTSTSNTLVGVCETAPAASAATVRVLVWPQF